MRCLFIYVKSFEGFSGQAAATELIIEGFHQQGIRCEEIHAPSLGRTKEQSKAMMYMQYSCRLLRCWWRAFLQTFQGNQAIHLNLGQSRVAMIRDGVALSLAGLFAGRQTVKAAALHGSVFTTWTSQSVEGRLFRWVIGKCKFVTCLGHQQGAALVALGIPAEKVQVVANVCEYDGISQSAVIAKQQSGENPVQLLFLSSLIDTKGFPEYLDALLELSSQEGPPIKAVLCGPISISPYSERFKTAADAKAWIVDRIGMINRSQRVQVEWIDGARGEAKRELFSNAQVFVLPTRYKVEAQPLCIIEAMGFGCAIITSAVGELPATVDDTCAIILQQPDIESVAQAIDKLCRDNALREKLAQGALKRFDSDFKRMNYINRWSELLGLAQVKS